MKKAGNCYCMVKEKKNYGKAGNTSVNLYIDGDKIIQFFSHGHSFILLAATEPIVNATAVSGFVTNDVFCVGHRPSPSVINKCMNNLESLAGALLGGGGLLLNQ